MIDGRTTGDLHDPALDLPAIAAAVAATLREAEPSMRFRILRRIRVGSRSLDVVVEDHAEDLGNPAALAALVGRIVAQTARHGWDRSDYAADSIERSFGTTVSVDPSYWGRRQTRRSGLPPSSMTPAAFMAAISVGDALDGLAGACAGRRHRVVSATKDRFVTDEGGRRATWRSPDRHCLVVSGSRIRIAAGGPADPDAHHEFEWTRR